MKKIILVLFLMFLALPLSAKEKIEITKPDLGVYVFKIDTKKYGQKIKPYVSKTLTTPKKVYDDNCFDLVVNGGFFDVENGKNASYVTIDGVLTGNIEKHLRLVENLKKENRLEEVLSRSELRILENKRHKLKFDIERHSDPIRKGYKIKHALGAGPMILPCADLAGEGFVVYDENGIVKSQSVDILKRRERTALGLKGKYLYIIIFTKDYRVDVNEMKNYLDEKLKLEKAMALDGGLSTAINHKDISIGSLGKYQRRVKSFLVIER